MIIIKKNKLRIFTHTFVLTLLTLTLYYVDNNLFILSLTFLILLIVFFLISKLEKYRQGLYFSSFIFESYINSESIIKKNLPFYIYYWDNKKRPIHLNFKEQ
ncbi:hypothetical protein ACSSVW_004084 [Pseudoalteromonas sp. MBR-15]